jgi:hypothetical protein
MYEASLTDLRSSIEGLGAEGLNWQPGASETNSIAVLANHALGSCRDWVCIALDAPRPSRSREAEFRSNFDSETSALTFVEALRGDTLRVFDVAGAVEWTGVVDTAAQPGDPFTTRAYCLMHAIEHLREHVAHLQLTRQLWDTAARNASASA